MGDKEEQAICKDIYSRIEEAGLWKGAGEQRPHLISPEPLALNNGQVAQLEKLGEALVKFYHAANDLYLRSGHEWVRDYLDIGKGDDLIRHAHMHYHKQTIPRIIRPDILLTEDGFITTELDSVPGGCGHLDCLSSAYEDAGFELVGSPRGVREKFARMMCDAAGIGDPVCAIVVSEESVDYLPEMTYLAGSLREIGLRAYTIRPNQFEFTEDGLYIETDVGKLRIDIVYRFFELFDLLNIPKSELVSYAARKKIVAITPPYKHFLEEKMLMALLHSQLLQDYWTKHLGDEYYALLTDTIAPTWIMDNRVVPPHAQISGFKWRGKPIRDWRDIIAGSQKDRRLVLKPSGFSPLAWGSRGVKIGHDMPEHEWSDVVNTALACFENSPYVIQPFHDSALIRVKYCDENVIREMQARVRLCPYYFVIEDQANLGGVLATACPKDKKLIHGMVDAVIMPCRSNGSRVLKQ